MLTFILRCGLIVSQTGLEHTSIWRVIELEMLLPQEILGMYYPILLGTLSKENNTKCLRLFSGLGRRIAKIKGSEIQMLLVS